MKIGFDVISDLNLTPDESFNWENKATSLYCIIAGNISKDLRVVYQTLSHLSHHYQAIFYIAGNLEFETSTTVSKRHTELSKICELINGVTYLQNNLITVNGLGIMGINGWFANNQEPENLIQELKYTGCNYDDFCYLSLTLEKVQLHLDVKKIIIVSASAPSQQLFFGESPTSVVLYQDLTDALINDTMQKVKYWIYGSYDKNVDTVIDGITFINNSYYKRKPYWAKRIEIEI